MRDNAGRRFRSVIVWGGLGAFAITRYYQATMFSSIPCEQLIIRISIQLLDIPMALPSHPVGGKYIPLDLVPPFLTGSTLSE